MHWKSPQLKRAAKKLKEYCVDGRSGVSDIRTALRKKKISMQ